MKLYARLAWTLISSPRKEKVPPLNACISSWTVMPHDIDLYGHMNNSRYSMIMDLARIDYSIRIGLLPVMKQNRWFPIVGATQIQFYKSLKLFKRYKVHTQLIYWDDKAFYFRHEFRSHTDNENGLEKPLARGYTQSFFRSKHGAVKPDDIIKATGHTDKSPPLTEELISRFPALKKSLKDETIAKEAIVENESGDPDLASMAGVKKEKYTNPGYSASEKVYKTNEPIAIVGIGCRFPGRVNDPGQFWDLLINGVNAIVDIPEDRWDPKKFYSSNKTAVARSYVQKAGIIQQDIRQFDARFFGISPREADAMDPQQRLLLEVSWEAMEDAGIDPFTLAKSKTGVFVGAFMTDAMSILSSPLARENLDQHSAVATTLTMLSNRLSYFYDFRGPSFSLDTACSASLVATHQACQSIWSGESENALVGGVNIILNPTPQITMSKGKFLSPTGQCHTFDASADGYVRGEGAGIVFLKPQSEAIKDGNPIYALIHASAINQDGKTSGITVPNQEAQVEVMNAAYSQAGINPSAVSFVEAHGTGTPIGDPIEVHALAEVLGKDRSADAPCFVSSVKTNIGHLEGGAGIAGLIKTALCLKHRQVVPHLNFNTPNPNIDFDALKLSVPLQNIKLQKQEGLYAGINSFGYGGTNAHVVLSAPLSMAEQTSLKPNNVPNDRPLVLPVSALGEETITELSSRYLDALKNVKDAANFCHNVAIRRSHHRNRLLIVENDTEGLKSSLAEVIQGKFAGASRAYGSILENPHLVWVYTGMGPQWWAMGAELMKEEPVYRAIVEKCDALFQEISGWSIITELAKNEENSRINVTEVAQPGIFVVQVGLTHLLRSWGVHPKAITGHSIGEAAAAYAGGALSLKDALTVVYHRSRLQQKTAGKGSMLAVGMEHREAEELLKEFKNVDIAAVNSPGSLTFAGEQSVLEEISELLNKAGKFNKFLRVEVPYHSFFMDEIKDELIESLTKINPRVPEIPTYSTVTGKPFGEQKHDARYWWANVRESVLFHKAFTEMADKGGNVFLEIGPHPVLGASISETITKAGMTGQAVPTLVRKQPESQRLAITLGNLYTLGIDPDWKSYQGEYEYIRLPNYPWQRQRYWKETERALRDRAGSDVHPMVIRENLSPGMPMLTALNTATLPFLADHTVAGNILFPGTGYIELAIASFHREHKDFRCSLEEIEFQKPSIVNDEDYVHILSDYSPNKHQFSCYHMKGEAVTQKCMTSKLYSGGRRPSALDISSIQSGLSPLNKEELYQELKEKGLEYGPLFQGVQMLYRSRGEVLSEIELPGSLTEEDYFIHPVLLDSALHSLIAAWEDDSNKHDIVPEGIDRFQFFELPGKELLAYGSITSVSDTAVKGDITLTDVNGEVYARVTGLSCRILKKSTQSLQERIRKWLYVRKWQEIDQKESMEQAHWVVIGMNEADLSYSDKDLPDNFTILPSIDKADEIVKLLSTAKSKLPLRVVDLRWSNIKRPEGSTPIEHGTQRANELLNTIQAIHSLPIERYFVVTKNAEPSEPNKCGLGIDYAPLIGLARTAMTEFPNLWITCVDLDDSISGFKNLMNYISLTGQEQEVRVRDEKLEVLRIGRFENDTADQEENDLVTIDNNSAYELIQETEGSLESLIFRSCDRAPLAPHEVEIAVEVASLHFKDVMKSLGLLSARVRSNTYFGEQIGMEGTGVVSAVGSEVTSFKPGDRVYSVFPGFMRSHVISSEDRVFKLADDISFADGSHLLTYLTVYHGLIDVARLQEGETILIHSATGGVGLAALEIAKLRKANIIATAGSEDKREYLRNWGVQHVSDSRSLKFVDDVSRWTDGKGVDVVLNFSPGETMVKSIDCLTRFGRFVELGKMSMDNDEVIRIRPFNENLTFAAIDFDRILRYKPEEVRRIITDVLRLLGTGELPFLPSKTYPASKIADAFHEMAHAKHRGKIGLGIRDPELKIKVEDRQPVFKKDATYLITGGLAGFGLQLAQWMVEEGAKNLVLLSRSGAKRENARQAVSEMISAGVNVKVEAIDVSNGSRISGLFANIKNDMPPLKGVFHLATVLDDKPFIELDHLSLKKVMNAKAAGAWHLHELTKTIELDHFVLFSSISSLIGNGGQGNYVAANNVLDQLATYREANSLPSLSINWGVFGEVGLVSRDEKIRQHLEHSGMMAFSTKDALQAMKVALKSHLSQIGIMDVNWARLSQGMILGTGNMRIAELSKENKEDSNVLTSPFLKKFDNLNFEEKTELLQLELVEIVAKIMRIPKDGIETNCPLSDLGLDSLMAIEISVDVESSLGLKINMMELSSGPSIDEIALNMVKAYES